VIEVRGAAKFFSSSIIAVLLVALYVTLFPQSGVFNFASASSTLPSENAEYANGTIALENSPLNVWYDWVNISNTQIINYVAYTNSDYPFPVPIANFVGQRFQLPDGSGIFVASALDKFEVYRDMDGDGIPQTGSTSGNNEILYWMYTNMSDGYSIIPIQKTMVDSIPHYTWGFTYQNAYAYLENYTSVYGLVAKLIFDHITVGYDFSMQGNVTNLKVNFDIGKVSNLTMLGSSNVSLDGLSLALLYTTSAYTAEPYSTFVNSQPYNSTTTNDSAVNAQSAQIAVGNTTAYDLVFGGNYTLSLGANNNNETNQANNETYTAKAETVALSSLPWETYGPPVWQMSFFGDALSLTNLFGGSWSPVDTNYNVSPLIYRVCFPVWGGGQIQYDPVYIAYLSGTSTISEFPSWVILILFMVAMLLTIIFIARRQRKATREPNSN
jgi:hypothetical protein